MTSRLTIDVGRHPGRRQGARAGVAVALLLGLGGCQTLSDINPLNLYHGLEGGPIADARPPPPNADQPYPNLANTPDKPADPDALVRGQVANGLIADRAHAQYEASVTPLPPPANGPPVSRGAPPPLKADPDASNATLAAANAPPPKPVPRSPIDNGPAPAPRTAPTTPVNSTAAAAAGRCDGGGPDARRAVSPAVAAEPARREAGDRPDTAARTMPPPAAPAAPSAPAGATPIAFAQGSSSLPSTTLTTLRAVAARRGNGSIAVTGFGEASSDTPANQVSAIPLAFARARAIAAQLEAAGVPTTAIRLDAEAVGNGAAVRVLP